MNERIEKLAEQCGFRSDPDIYDRNQSFDIERFAELLVRECISTIENAENGYQDYRNQIEDGMRDHCISLVKNKFGVKE